MVGEGGEEDTAGTDGDDESEEDDTKEKKDPEKEGAKTPGLALGPSKQDPRESLSSLLDRPGSKAMAPPPPPDWVEVGVSSHWQLISAPSGAEEEQGGAKEPVQGAGYRYLLTHFPYRLLLLTLCVSRCKD